MEKPNKERISVPLRQRSNLFDKTQTRYVFCVNMYVRTIVLKELENFILKSGRHHVVRKPKFIKILRAGENKVIHLEILVRKVIGF